MPQLREAAMTYAEWIADFEQQRLREVILVGDEGMSDEERLSWVLKGTCGWAVDQMVAAFPELRRVRGHYGFTPHWWCVAPDGVIWDPSQRQFQVAAAYVEYTGPDPIGKCMNCGDLIWTGTRTSACSDECERELEFYYR